MAYTTINKSTENFDATTWTGNSTARNITIGHQPDLVWIKRRDGTYQHNWFDAVRGATKPIHSESTDAESTNANTLTAFISNGFSIGTDSGASSTNGGVNSLDDTYASWGWKAGNSSGSSNSDGDITSTVSANTTAGFSIVKWTGDGTTASTVGHGLGVKPGMIIARDYAQTKHWFVYHKSLTDNYVMTLNSSDEQKTGNSYWGSGSLMKSSSSPTTTTFSFNGSGSSVTNINGNGYTNIAYCFAEKIGFSKFGDYTGNGNTDGPFIYTGFKPAFVIVKNRSSSANWVMTDNKISFNGKGSNDSNCLFPSSTASESDAYGILLHSNGFSLKGSDSASATVNSSGNIYIYMAFAEAPLVGTNNVPATAK